jgi:hypothetical protein
MDVDMEYMDVNVNVEQMEYMRCSLRWAISGHQRRLSMLDFSLVILISLS